MKMFHVVVRLALAAIGIFALYDSAQLWPSEWFFAFTSQANVMAAGVMVWAAAATMVEKPGPPAWLQGGVTLYLAITAVVFAAVMGYPSLRPEESFLWFNNTELLHAVVPIGAMLVWILFVEHRRLTWQWSGWWLVYLFGYLVMTLVRARVDLEAEHPYTFIDRDVLGWSGLAANMVVYTIAFGAAGAALIGLDRVLPGRTRLTEGRGMTSG